MKAAESLSSGDLVVLDGNWVYRMRPGSQKPAIGIVQKPLRAGDMIFVRDILAQQSVYILDWEGQKWQVKKLISSLEATWQKLYGRK